MTMRSPKLVAIAGCLLFFTSSAFAAISKDQIILKLRRSVPSWIIERDVRAQGLAFSMDEGAASELRGKGASESLIRTLFEVSQKNQPFEQVPTPEKKLAETGSEASSFKMPDAKSARGRQGEETDSTKAYRSQTTQSKKSRAVVHGSHRNNMVDTGLIEDKEGNLEPAPGYEWVNPSDSNNFHVKKIGGLLNENGNLEPSPGYEWVDPNDPKNLNVRLRPGLVLDKDGKFTPAHGYDWLNPNDPDDLDVKLKLPQ